MIPEFDVGKFANPPRVGADWPLPTSAEIDASIPAYRGFGVRDGVDMHTNWAAAGNGLRGHRKLTNPTRAAELIATIMNQRADDPAIVETARELRSLWVEADSIGDDFGTRPGDGVCGH